jgi:uncharacterized protein YjiS (DUF1127 family)
VRLSIKILGHSAEKYASAISASKARPSPDPAATYPKDQRTAEMVQIRPRGLAPLPVSEAARGPLPSRASRVFGIALTSCWRLILSLQTRPDLHQLNDYQLRDIGLWRDRIQPPLLTILAERHLWRW